MPTDRRVYQFIVKLDRTYGAQRYFEFDETFASLHKLIRRLFIFELIGIYKFTIAELNTGTLREFENIGLLVVSDEEVFIKFNNVLTLSKSLY